MQKIKGICALRALLEPIEPWGHSAEAEHLIGKKVSIRDIFMVLPVLRPQECAPELMLQHSWGFDG